MSRIREKAAEFQDAKRVMKMGLYPYFRSIESEQGQTVIMDGKEVVMMGSNNYLGLTNHPEVKAAAKEAIDRYGTGCAGSRFLNGTLSIHQECEEKLAEFMGTEAAIVFSTGFMTNQGSIPYLVPRDGSLFLDHADHASIIDGARLGHGKVVKFRHRDMEDLEKKLRLSNSSIKLIVVDGIFSMEGDIAPLPELVEVAKRYDAEVLLDDAHSIGVLGKTGRGTASHFGLENEILGTVGTFSKSFASIGGFFAGPEDVAHFLKHHSRPFIFSASPPPANMAAVIKSIEIIDREPERIVQLHQRTKYLVHALQDAGFSIHDHGTPIIPVYVRDTMLVFKACMRLQEEGVFVNPVISPAVEPHNDLIRLSVMSSLTEEHLDFAVDKLIKVGRELGFLGDDGKDAVAVANGQAEREE
ncbi:8-amino-7-oxononanoate synthase [bacterium BMS3Bbin04]|nr:8-amino-7-oxononanoate synthase [bacterium BMS3Bbin04]